MVKLENDYSDEQLLNAIRRFYKENRRAPTQNDFKNNEKYPNYGTYHLRFGGWVNSLRMSGIEINNEAYKNTLNRKSKGGKKNAIINDSKKYTTEELISLLRKYYEDYKKVPSLIDFKENPNYPSHSTYINHFKSWSNALKIAGLDADTLVKKGIVECSYHKGRAFEMIVNKSFKKESSDLSGQNCNSPFDGICPRGYNYDAKSSKLTANTRSSKGWFFHFRNKQINIIQYFILGGFNEDYTKLLHVWMIPLSFVNGRDTIYIGQYSINNFKEYEITDRCINLNKLTETTEVTKLDVKNDIVISSKVKNPQKSLADY